MHATITAFLLFAGAIGPHRTGKLARYARLLGITLEHDTLRDVVKRIGRADIKLNVGDAHGG